MAKHIIIRLSIVLFVLVGIFLSYSLFRFIDTPANVKAESLDGLLVFLNYFFAALVFLFLAMIALSIESLFLHRRGEHRKRNFNLCFAILITMLFLLIVLPLFFGVGVFY